MINITINNQKIAVEEGATVLEAARKLGIKIPTLCNHKALMPYGSCRLCLVEVGKGEKVKIHASCTHPALEGIIVRTDTDRIVKIRKVIAELLLARCPDAKKVQKMAEELGVKETRFKKKNDDCILCGLCVRMCEERMGQSAISFTGRGFRRGIKSPYGFPSNVCQVCGACAFICPTNKIKYPETFEYSDKTPVLIPYEFNEGIIPRPVVHIPYPQAVPNKAVIDSRYCIKKLKNDCGICKEVCEAKAIDYEQKEEDIKLNVGAVVVAPGYELFNAHLKSEYGYGHFPNVVTAIEFERIMSASGPFSGHISRPSDDAEPKKVAFIQCVGSRDFERNYCSSICCMYATKEAIIAKEHIGEHLECDIFFMDMRAYGKGFDEYYQRAKNAGVRYIRSRPSSIEENPDTKNLKIAYMDENNDRKMNEYDIVVLSTGMQPAKYVKDLSGKLGFELNEYGFCSTDYFTPVNSTREGVFVCGPFVEPKDIPETVMQASGAAAKVMNILGDVRGTMIAPKIYPPEIDVSGQEPRIGVFVCHCGTNIAGVVNVPEVVEFAKTLPDVVYAENNLYTCSNDTQEKIKQIIKEHNLNRVIVASCSPRTHEPLFRNTIREAGLNPYLFEMANIRDQCSWVHMFEPEKATKKAKALVAMALAKSRLLEPLEKKSIPMTKSALVVGGGLSGMTSALALAESGFPVHLVEKEKELGGNLKNIHYLFNGEDPQEELKKIVRKVGDNKLIRTYTDSKIAGIDGFIGNFKTTVKDGDGALHEIAHGAIIVATGAKYYNPTEYLYGADNRVMSQLELEKRIVSGNTADLKTVVMIQCVGSRTEERPYCSRICCSEAIKNALKLKEKNPKINVFVLYRDIRTYGFREKYYTKAREAGVIFVRYDEEKKPEVVKDGDKLCVTVYDPILGSPVRINADLLVLSAGIIPEDNNELAQFLKVPLDQNKFFLEAHMKLRPVDFATEGIFLCGLAHSPKSIDESIAQALASSSRASTALSKDSLDLEATISEVVDENCDGCAYCIDTCPYKALTLIEYARDGSIKKTVQTNESACKGCGCCMATCPKKGIYVKGFRLEQISAQVGAALEN